MNILLVCRGYLAGGGAGSRWRSLANHLSREHRIFVATSSPRSLHSEINGGKMRVLRVPIFPAITNIPFLASLNAFLLLFYLSRFVSRIDVDLIIATIPEFEEGIASAIVSRTFHRKLVVDVRDLIVEDHVESVYSVFPRFIRHAIQFLYSNFFVSVTNSSSLVVTVTPTLKQYLMSTGVMAPIEVIPNGADTSVFRPASAKERIKIRNEFGFGDEPLILYAGAMGVSYYPMDVIFKAFQLVTHSIPSAKLVLCGSIDQSTAKNVERFESKAKYVGLLNQEDMAKLMRACDVGVISMDNRKSTFCALTTKFFEYIASGMAIVAACPAGGELDKMITLKEVGYAVGSGDYRSMGNRIIELLNNEQERRILGRNGIKLVASTFDRKKLAVSYDERLLKVKQQSD